MIALAGGLAGILIFVALFFATGNGEHGHYGLIQRLTLAAAGIWVAALAVGLLAIYGHSRVRAVRFVESLRTLPGGRLLVEPGSGWRARSSGLSR